MTAADTARETFLLQSGDRAVNRQAARKPDTQDRVTRVYDRAAPIYDVFVAPMEWLGGTRRRDRVLGRASGDVLEVGIGTGRSLDHYPPGVRLTGIDISEGMLSRARACAERLGFDVRLQHGDVQALDFPDASFDTVTAACVFCSVADPVKGLREVARVVKPDGQVLALEHVRPRNPFLGWLADRLSPLTRRLIGPEINRRTEENVTAAGLEIVDVRKEGIWREIVARRASDG
jgi:ubiquinone/menaquinone biosynthesis C-methylase UbiE